MALFPNSYIVDYTGKDSAVRERVEKFHDDAIMYNQSFQQEAHTDTRFNAGDQTLWSEYYNVPLRTRKNFSFNRLRRISNLLSGYQRRSRKSMIAMPKENGSQDGADQFTKLLYEVAGDSCALDVLSEAFSGAIVSGMNIMQLWIDYRDDPISGDIRIDNCGYNSFIIDPYFQKKDLSDCNAIWKRSFLTKEACMSLMPEKKELIKDMSPGAYTDGKFNYMIEETTRSNNLFTYDEFYYRDYRKKKTVFDSVTKQTIEWTGTDKDLRAYIAPFPQLQVIESTIPTVKLSVLVNGQVMYDGKNPLNIDAYPFVPVFCYFDPSINDFTLKIQGVIRDLRDAQYLYNRRKIIEFDYAESVGTNGYIYKETSLVDKTDPYKTGQGQMIRIKKNASLDDIRPIPMNEVPQSFFQLSESLNREFQEISGANEELLGIADDFKSAALAKLRHGWALIQQQTIFDQLDASQKQLGNLIVKLIQKNFTPEKVARIIGEQPVDEFYNKLFSKYDITIEEGFDTATQKQQEFASLLMLKDSGAQIPDSALINAASVQNKGELIKMMEEQKQQAQQLEQQQAEISMQEQQATTDMIKARAESDMALANKRQSDIQKTGFDMMDKTLEANREEQKVDLEAVRTLKELEQLDINRINELLELMRMVQQQREENNIGVNTM